MFANVAVCLLLVSLEVTSDVRLNHLLLLQSSMTVLAS